MEALAWVAYAATGMAVLDRRPRIGPDLEPDCGRYRTAGFDPSVLAGQGRLGRRRSDRPVRPVRRLQRLSHVRRYRRSCAGHRPADPIGKTTHSSSAQAGPAAGRGDRRRRTRPADHGHSDRRTRPGRHRDDQPRPGHDITGLASANARNQAVHHTHTKLHTVPDISDGIAHSSSHISITGAITVGPVDHDETAAADTETLRACGDGAGRLVDQRPGRENRLQPGPVRFGLD